MKQYQSTTTLSQTPHTRVITDPDPRIDTLLQRLLTLSATVDQQSRQLQRLEQQLSLAESVIDKLRR